MASRISQMRNGLQQTPPQQQQQYLNNSINQIKQLMQNLQGMQNPESALINLLQNNPQMNQLISLYRNGNLQQVAQQLAAQKGVNLNDIINQLLH